MAAMDFPANPTNGQVYGNYVYSTATGAWNAKPLTGQKAVVSATAPSAPSMGDEWFNSNDGNLYVYYTDVDGSQWVQVKSDATLSSTLGNRVTSLETYPSGLVPIIPTSVAVAAGSASVSSTGVITLTGAGSMGINGCFTSAYENYLIVWNYTLANADDAIYFRLRLNGTNTTGTSYAMVYTEQSAGNVTPNTTSSSGIGDLRYGRNSSGTGSAGQFQVFSPFSAKATRYSSVGNDNDYSFRATGVLRDSVSYDGIGLYGGANSYITGTIRVYGYR